MSTPIPAETLAWLHQAAAAGVAEPMVLCHLIERVEALEADATEQSRSAAFCNDATVRRLEALERRPNSTSPPAPAGGLVERVAKAIGDLVYDAPFPADLNRIDARAAIREVAAWLDSNACLPDDATPREADGWKMAAQILNREANR
jgi:hypothetical protein